MAKHLVLGALVAHRVCSAAHVVLAVSVLLLLQVRLIAPRAPFPVVLQVCNGARAGPAAWAAGARQSTWSWAPLLRSGFAQSYTMPCHEL